MGLKEKIKFAFLRLFDNLLSKYVLKEFLAGNDCFGLFTKIKKGSRTSFCCKFSTWFFHRNVPYLILYQLPKFQCHNFFPSQDIKQNVLFNSCLNNWCKIYFRSSSETMANRKKERKTGMPNVEYLESENCFLDELKSISHNYWGAIIWWKNESYGHKL